MSWPVSPPTNCPRSKLTSQSAVPTISPDTAPVSGPNSMVNTTKATGPTTRPVLRTIPGPIPVWAGPTVRSTIMSTASPANGPTIKLSVRKVPRSRARTAPGPFAVSTFVSAGFSPVASASTRPLPRAPPRPTSGEIVKPNSRPRARMIAAARNADLRFRSVNDQPTPRVGLTPLLPSAHQAKSEVPARLHWRYRARKVRYCSAWRAVHARLRGRSGPGL